MNNTFDLSNLFVLRACDENVYISKHVFLKIHINSEEFLNNLDWRIRLLKPICFWKRVWHCIFLDWRYIFASLPDVPSLR